MSRDMDLLRQAIALAEAAGERGNRPFGAVITTTDGVVIATGRNEVAETGMATAHAELTAVTAATEAGRAVDLIGATVYASGEPCPMCSAAMVWAGIGRIVFAAAEPDFSEIIDGGPRFTLRCADVVGAADVDLDVSGPHLGEEALAPFHRFAENFPGGDNRAVTRDTDWARVSGKSQEGP
ncbi:nucleoside deaminase [Nocardia donostiensis]|uniref:tRNA-specific adenosine deaminase n=1 Tax=Nocardia donostiensis TaxID=1538463 RepID=A0A1V2TDE9_9NOCA|nr:nucleoside deaminase [Nocardia donostiensis]ONM47371.1 tRNA-specific adenosine deaminase [Nocardia donostiensis]OQS24162.1 tRNA-specific adenosine deaminase [Nocardia donostiensis]